MRRALGLVEEQERVRRYVRILQLLAENEKQLNKNGIWLQLKGNGFGSEPTVLYAIDDLGKWGMVILVKTRRLVPGGKTFNYYKLTRDGIENLICAGVLSTKSISLSTVKLLLQKYRELLPYATQISQLWPIFVEAKVEDIAMKRLAMFIGHFHGEQLYYRVRNPRGPPIIGSHAISNLKVADLAETFRNLSLNCTAEDDVEAFLDPHSQFYGIAASYQYERGISDDEYHRWIMAVRSNEKLQTILARAALKEAVSHLRSSNGTLKLLADKPIRLSDSDAETYRKLMAEVDLLRSKIVVPPR